MNKFRVVPITTVEEYEKAKGAGARIEFTGCGCRYDLPPADEAGSEGWISANPFNWIARELENGPLAGSGHRLRALYPIRRPLLSRLFFWRKA